MQSHVKVSALRSGRSFCAEPIAELEPVVGCGRLFAFAIHLFLVYSREKREGIWAPPPGLLGKPKLKIPVVEKFLWILQVPTRECVL